MIAPQFSNYYYDLGETYGMKFVRACADKVAALKEHRGVAEPRFLFYLGGEMVADVPGADIPKIVEMIKTKAPKNE